jgi:hypothetical protein
MTAPWRARPMRQFDPCSSPCRTCAHRLGRRSQFLMPRIALPIFPVSGMRSAITARKEAADGPPMGSGLQAGIMASSYEAISC